ncbi:MAG: hypothetical protein V4509_00565 [Patescibacteria group bacterium]
MEKIVIKAREGGYNIAEWGYSSLPRVDKDDFLLMCCDPLFWQALGKAMDWKGGKYQVHQKGILAEIDELNGLKTYKFSGWLHYAMNFHEINLTQGFDEAVKWLSDLIPHSNDTK